MPSIRTSLATAAVVVTATACGLVGGAGHADAATYSVLFDDAHAETAGNADWVVSTSQPDPTGEDANPSSETDWTGALSSWGVALQKTGDYSVETNPDGQDLTYGGGGDLDLKNFQALVLPEPNTALTASERAAVVTFVKNGGGLFLISDHTGSDRNNDGVDSVGVLNQLMTDNGVADDPFGFSIDKQNYANEDPANIPSDVKSGPIVSGANGTVTGSILRNGTTVTLHKDANSAAQGIVYRDSATAGGDTGVFFATSTYGTGRVAYWGDSSPIDDGTGASGENLFDGWNDPAGTDAALALNATDWLAGRG